MNLLRLLLLLAATLLPAWANVSGNIACTPTTQDLWYDARGPEYDWGRNSGGITCDFTSLNAASVQHAYVFWTSGTNSGSQCRLTIGTDRTTSPNAGSGMDLVGGYAQDGNIWVNSTGGGTSLYPQRDDTPGQYCDTVVSSPYVVVTYIPANTAPVTVSSSGLPAQFNIGIEQTISATVRDANGYANINYFSVLLSYGVDGTNSCYFLIYPNSNTVYLMNDAASSWGAGATFGAATTLSNASCRLNAQTSSRSISGTDASATLKITFLPGVFNRGGGRTNATTNSYLSVIDAANATSNWQGPYQSATARTGPKLIIANR